MGNFKEFLINHKNKIYFILISLFILLGFLLRILGLNKVDGFWYDEVLCFDIAKQSFPFGILDRLYNQDFHAPLYYFGLHFWSNFVNDNETLIRFFSVIFGVLILPVFYFIGKELGSRRAGLYSLILASVNSGLIYYSQEVRFYSLLPFLTALTVLFMVKIKNNPCKTHCLGLAIINLLILYTYTLGNLYVFLELIILAGYLFFKNKKSLKRFIISQILVLSLYIPYLPTFFHFMKNSSNSIAGNFWWVTVGITSPILVLQDWFSPILINLRSHPLNYYSSLYTDSASLLFMIFIFVPILIYFIGLIKTVIQKNFASLIFLFGLLFFIIEIFMAFQGKFGLMTRYTIIILPIMIISAGYGLAKFKNSFISLCLIGIFFSLSLFYLLFIPASASKAPRDGYHKYIAELEKYNPNENDVIIIPYGGRFFARYYKNHKARILPFDIELMYVLNKKLDTVFDKDTINSISNNTFKDKTLLRTYIGTLEPAPELEKYFKTEVLSDLNENGRVFLIISGGINAFNPKILKKITLNDNYYFDIPIFTLLSSKTTNDLFQLNYNNLNYIYNKNYEGWQLYVFKKS